MILRRLTMVLVAAVAFSPLAVPVAEAVDLIKPAVASGAAHLAGLQNLDGGWCFDIPYAGPPNPCGGVSPTNTFGVTALGLLDAYKLTPSATLLTKAKFTGDKPVLRGPTTTNCGFDGDGGDTPMRTADAVFLLDLAQATGTASYKNAAKAFITCVVAESEALSPLDSAGTSRANNRIDRRQLGAWDAAFDVRAALKTGSPTDKTFAIAELTRVLERQAEWEVPCTGALFAGCDLVTELEGKAHLLLAMLPIANATPLIHSKIAEYVGDLVAAQAAAGDGSFGSKPGGDTQTQLAAYAILGIKPYASTAALKTVVSNGVNFLLGQQTFANNGGGFDDGTGLVENTEVDSEALQALKAAHP